MNKHLLVLGLLATSTCAAVAAERPDGALGTDSIGAFGMYMNSSKSDGKNTPDFDYTGFGLDINKHLLKADDVGFDVSLMLELVPEKVYVARKRVFSAILKDATIEDAVHFCAGSLGYTKLFFVKPDNTRVYENLIIPPLTNLSGAISYLQGASGLGIYEKSANCYVTNDRMYIYPDEYDNPKTIKTIHTYLPGNDAFPNLGCYHYLDPLSNDLFILAGAGKFTNTDISDAHAENIGNSVILQRSSAILDHMVDMTDPLVPTIATSNLSSTISYTTRAGMKTGTKSIRFAYSANNEYYHKSILAAGNKTVCYVPWAASVPLCIHPGSRIVMYHDTHDNFVSKSGIVEGVISEINQLDTRSMRRRFVCNSTLVVATSPDDPIVVAPSEEIPKAGKQVDVGNQGYQFS
jgi:hypothetical protein